MHKTLIESFLITLILSFCSQAMADEDILAEDKADFEIEVEKTISDSDAAKLEALAAQKRMERELKKTEAQKNLFYKEKQRLDAEIMRLKSQISNYETKTLEAKLQAEKIKKESKDLNEKYDKIAKETAEAKANYEKFEADKSAAEKELAEAKLLIEKSTAELEDFKKKEALSKQAYGSISSTLEQIRQRVKQVVSERDKASQSHLALINKYRKALRKAMKATAEMEVAVEVDRAYDDEAQAQKLIQPGERTVSSLNRSKIAKVTSNICELKAFPVDDAKAFARVPGGRSVRVRDHDGAWYTLIYKGKKAFIDKGCFQ